MESISQFWRKNVKKFGVYKKVLPVAFTPVREVPDHIPKPDYIKYNNSGPEHNILEIKNTTQINGMRRSCKLAAGILRKVHDYIKPGISTNDIDIFVHDLIIEANAYPSPLLYKGYPKSVCTSVNNVIVHGIPDLRLLEDSDIVNVDLTVFYEGYHGDCSKTFLVGKVDDRGRELIQVTEECLDRAINVCGPDVPFTEIGSQIYNHAKKHDLTVVPSVLGHGIGSYFHGLPEIYHTINDYPGKMKPGITFTIEPAITHGNGDAVLLEDYWTLMTDDGSRSAQAEHTILITENGAEILTK